MSLEVLFLHNYNDAADDNQARNLQKTPKGKIVAEGYQVKYSNIAITVMLNTVRISILVSCQEIFWHFLKEKKSNLE